MAASGSIQEITLKGRRFPVAADADVSRKLGGFEKEKQYNGDGSSRSVMTRIGWKLDGVVVEVDDTRGDQEFLQEVADSIDDVPVTITLVSGNTYQAVGTITGEIVFSTMNGTAQITLEGGGAKLVVQ